MKDIRDYSPQGAMRETPDLCSKQLRSSGLGIACVMGLISTVLGESIGPESSGNSHHCQTSDSLFC